MNPQAHQKITANHLHRNAYLYIRQSTLRQVLENTESTRRQYALRDRAVALGWPIERIIIIDCDQAHSGASSADREGFRKLVAEVGVGRAGIVLGIEVSRLARNCSDWHHLLEICALTETLILDEDGVYDPGAFNDRLLLGLKGTMSEAELHVLRARMRGGLLSQARRGALKTPLPVGFVYDADDNVVFDPDAQVQQAIRHLFGTFERSGSAYGTVKVFHQEQLSFPHRPRTRSPLEPLWGPIHVCHVLNVLHNPRYAGAFSFGRTRTRKGVDGKVHTSAQSREDWIALLPNAHAGYITWEQFESNLERLRQAAQAHGKDRRRSPPREGPALLQGIVVCGVCGLRMTLCYHARAGTLSPRYVCQRKGIESATPICQSIPGAGIDAAIGELLIETVTPLTIEVALQVQQEVEARFEEADKLRHLQVERARYAAELARRRYLQVDPDNRLVADVLEADWNEKLRELSAAQEEYERRCTAERQLLDDEHRSQILSLATDFPRLWRDPRTPQRERKRMVRLLIEDVTLIKKDQVGVIDAHVRFCGGTTRTLTLPTPKPSYHSWQTAPETLAQIDGLTEHHSDDEIARILNERGVSSGKGRPFHASIVQRLRREHGIKDRFHRLRDHGMLTLREMAARLGVTTDTVKRWRRHGLLRAHAYNEKKESLFEPPGHSPPIKQQGRKLSKRARFSEVQPDDTKEVQYEV